MKYYLKFLGQDRQPCLGGNGQWPEPGVWTETIEKPIPCILGYHLCRKQDFFHWCNAATLWVAEAEGVVLDDTKVVASRARLIRQVEEWNERNQRLFAADCAERVLKHFEEECPDDKRPRVAIETTRRFAKGQATVVELAVAELAARSAARSSLDYVVGSVAWSAAWSAVWSASTAPRATDYTTYYATRSVTKSPERNWQINHLLTHYLKLNPEDFE